MILHFSHIGLTEGRTFTLDSLSVGKTLWLWVLAEALATGTVAATTDEGHTRRWTDPLRAHRGMLAPSMGGTENLPARTG